MTSGKWKELAFEDSRQLVREGLVSVPIHDCCFCADLEMIAGRYLAAMDGNIARFTEMARGQSYDTRERISRGFGAVRQQELRHARHGIDQAIDCLKSRLDFAEDETPAGANIIGRWTPSGALTMTLQ